VDEAKARAIAPSAPRPSARTAKPDAAPPSTVDEPLPSGPDVVARRDAATARDRLGGQAVVPRAEPPAARPEAGSEAKDPERVVQAPAAPVKPTLPKPPAARPAPTAPARPAAARDANWTTVGLLAAGALALLIGLVVFVRSRGRRGGLASMGHGQEGEEDEEPLIRWGEPQAEEDVESSGAQAGGGYTAGTGLFDDEEPEKGESEMESQASGFAAESASEMPTQMGVGAGDGDVARLVRQLERRIAQLETRLDEANDARERLERQVAAHSEELRVQRAAIARTQRALRSMSRGDEEQATEPALRDPSRPGRG
jgi:hypothetical protein